MKAFVLEGKHSSAFIEINLESPLDNELVVAVKTIGLCGSDLKTFDDQNPMVKFPVIPGHEIGCEVVAKGSKVPDEIEIGNRGTVFPYTSCGNCPACLSGRFNTCSDNKTLGVARDGAAREFLTINYKDFIMCQDMDFADIALIEPLSVGRHAVVRAGDVNGKNVLLFGFGIIGVGVLMELKRQGATVIVAEISDLKLSLAKQMGADHVINTAKAEYKKNINDFVGNKGINVVIDAVGASVVVSAALEICSVAGTVVLIGYHSDLFPFNSKSIVSKELAVLGSRNALLADFKVVRETLKSDIVLKEVLITKRFSFDNLEKAFMFWSKKRDLVTKILIDI